MVSSAKVEDLQSKGPEAMEASTGERLDISGLKNLVNFQKDQFDNFQSTSEPFDEWLRSSVPISLTRTRNSGVS